jgi:hypothetical protein
LNTPINNIASDRSAPFAFLTLISVASNFRAADLMRQKFSTGLDIEANHDNWSTMRRKFKMQP